MNYTLDEVISIAKSVMGKRIGDYDTDNKIMGTKSKGRVGHVMESSVYGYDINSDRSPDFKNIGVELKTTGYKWVYNGTKVSAKERLVITMINYFEDIKIPYIESSLYEQIQKILLILYEYEQGKKLQDIIYSEYYLYDYQNIPKKDKLIIENDWQTIINKIKQGLAHELSESDTMYLGACTKGQNSKSLVKQPFSEEMAMSRAFSLKSKYMTYLLRNNVFNEHEDRESFVKNLDELEKDTFENIVINNFKKYVGLSVVQISEVIDFEISKSKPKHVLSQVTSRMMNVEESNLHNLEEFDKASIEIKTINLDYRNKLKESMSFPMFKFDEIINETWDDSNLYEFLESTKFLFVVFKTLENGETVFQGSFFWNMPPSILNTYVKDVWEKTTGILKSDLELVIKNNRVYNNLPKKTQNKVAHVRPHGRNRADTMLLSSSTNLKIVENDNSVYLSIFTRDHSFTKQCFWLNNDYILELVKSNLPID